MPCVRDALHTDREPEHLLLRIARRGRKRAQKLPDRFKIIRLVAVRKLQKPGSQCISVQVEQRGIGKL